MVEEDWRLGGDGTFIRQRFYRNAKWRFTLLPFLLRRRNSRHALPPAASYE
jgi:hypothetical protein